VSAALPYCCNSFQSTPPLAGWDNSTLSTALSPGRLPQGSTRALLWDIEFLPHNPPSVFVPCPTSACCSCLACHLIPTFSLCYLSCLRLLRFWLLVPSLFSQAGSVLNPTVNVKLQFTVYAFQFCLRGIQLTQGLHWVMFLGDWWGSPMWCMLLTCWVCRFMQASLKSASSKK
jgi:hypothetical protein